jgi:hypothetical protein
VIAVAFNLFLVTCCSFALWRGGKPERIGALMLATASLLSALMVRWDDAYRHVEWGVMLIDIALFAGLLALALKANRYWPLWLTSFQLVTLWSHLAASALTATMPLAYAIASMAWSYPMLIILVLGAQRHARRRLQYGADPAWTTPYRN